MLHFGFCLVYQDKEERYKHNTEYNGKYHSEENTRTDWPDGSAEPGPLANTIGSSSQYKGEGSHQDRPETELGSMDGRLYQVSSLVNLQPWQTPQSKWHSLPQAPPASPSRFGNKYHSPIRISQRPDRHPKRQPAVKAIQR